MNTTPNSLQVGMIGNCAYSALIDQQARIVWCCLPRFDGDPVFNAMLDPSENGSLWALELEDFERSEQQYEPNTAILRTRLFDRQGQGIEITDVAPRFFNRGRTFRPLTIIRRLKVLAGTPRIRVLLRLRFDWGRQLPVVTADEEASPVPGHELADADSLGHVPRSYDRTRSVDRGGGRYCPSDSMIRRAMYAASAPTPPMSAETMVWRKRSPTK